MECGVQSAMISVPPSGDSVPQTLTTTVFAPPDTDQAQFEADKRAVYKHPLFPLLALLFERCELATQSSDTQSSDAFNLDIQAFVQHQERDRKPFLSNEPEIDGLMIKAIQVLRIHLLELEKVQELCKDFCNRYITCLKGKMQSENLLRSDYPQDILGSNLMNNLENNNNMMSSHGNNSDSGSTSNSPIQYSISPPQQQSQQQNIGNSLMDQTSPTPTGTTTPTNYNLNHYNGGGGGQQATTTTNISSSSSTSATTATTLQSSQCENLVVHGSTPLSQIGINLCSGGTASESSGQLSPAPTTLSGSADDCDSDFTTRCNNGNTSNNNCPKQKRGVLPKHATSVMRSWLFQHLVHPYPTEDEKRHIAAQTNLTLLQVNNWFINARRRILQPMLDASTPNDSNNLSTSPNHHHNNNNSSNKKKKTQNNNRRFWSQDFANIQPQIDSGILSSSDDDGDSYSSDGDEGSLVIDSNIQNNSNGGGDISNQNGQQQQPQIDPLAFTTNSNNNNNSDDNNRERQ